MTGIRLTQIFAVFIVAVTFVSGDGRVRAHEIIGTEWCNTYLPPELFSSVPADEVPRPAMFKYGAAVHSPEFDRLQAARWWLDFLIAPASARNRRVMYLYPVSDLDGKNLTALIGKIARQQGRETPMVGFVATPGALKNLGNEIEDGDQSKYIIVPIWWNKRVATSLRGIARMLDAGLTEARDRFSAVVAALVARGHAYSPDFDSCHPPRGTVLPLSNKPVLLRALHDDVFFASNQPIDVIKGEPRKIIAHERHWPTLDE